MRVLIAALLLFTSTLFAQPSAIIFDFGSVLTNWEESIDPNEQLFILAEVLEANGYVVGIVSDLSQEESEFAERLGYYQLFNPIIAGFEKDDPKLYVEMVDSLHRDPQEIIFVDSEDESVEMARSFGIDGIKFESYEQLLVELELRGVLNSIMLVSCIKG